MLYLDNCAYTIDNIPQILSSFCLQINKNQLLDMNQISIFGVYILNLSMCLFLFSIAFLCEPRGTLKREIQSRR